MAAEAGYERSAAAVGSRHGKMAHVPHSVLVVLLFALAGFLLGGAYTNWTKARRLAIALGVCGVLAAAGAVAWML
ncbi:hypothetical protein [Nocardia sp. BMG51109]|uniref:hypothetical protein n=1 Tax=Nocardia sp. BMG51109 TaxID=1056816 RepID=UPI0012EC7083|nr:hypothetical protein [Nocardia sp. BMG51109]